MDKTVERYMIGIVSKKVIQFIMILQHNIEFQPWSAHLDTFSQISYNEKHVKTPTLFVLLTCKLGLQLLIM